MGSQTTLVSKNGTNQIHGLLFEYLRNSVLDARNFFDYTTPRRLPAFTRNQFGASAGGAIKKDKTFYFATYEGLRERLGATLVATSIAAGCRGPAGSTITNVSCPQLGPATPSVQISSVTVPLLSLYPIPNLPSCWVGGDLRINPNWGSIEYKTANSNSFYHSLQLGLTKRLSRGVQFQTSYTWSKLVDELQSQLGNFESLSSSSWPSDPLNRKLDRSPASFDVTQNLRFNAIYRLPAFASQSGWRGTLLNGWWTSGILSLQTGYPFTPILVANRSRSGVAGGAAPVDRPNLVSGRNTGNITGGTTAGCPWAPGVRAGQSLGTPDLYFDPCAFTLQPAGFLGSASRNSLRGPGLASLDFSLVKDTHLKRLGESGKLEFRAEFFNLLNRANFGTPGIGITGDNSAQVFAGRADNETVLQTAARLTTTATRSRQIQLALKILF